MWSRIMRREAGIGKSADLNRVMPKIQVGLKSVHAARLKIEDIMNRAPEAAESDQMKILEKSVYKNIEDIKSALDQVEKQQGGASTHSGVIKKLRNDVQKEEVSLSVLRLTLNSNSCVVILCGCFTMTVRCACWYPVNLVSHHLLSRTLHV